MGANLALEDAYILFRCFSSFPSVDIPKTLSRFVSLRHARGTSIPQNSRGTGTMEMMSNPVGVYLRNRIFKYAMESGKVYDVLFDNIYGYEPEGVDVS
ncbi:hypothetical protein HDV00_004777 [Rhizophlyctis rosea]|nr:hypothetical protein HDV00_004777 [Rhizophlyctis rosea]